MFFSYIHERVLALIIMRNESQFNHFQAKQNQMNQRQETVRKLREHGNSVNFYWNFFLFPRKTEDLTAPIKAKYMKRFFRL